MNLVRVILNVCLVISCLSVVCFACNNYEIKEYDLDTTRCPLILKDPNWKIILDSDCNLITEGCVNYNTSKSLKIRYKVEKKPLFNTQGNVDACQMMKDNANDKIVQGVVAMLGSAECPIPQGKVCNKKFNVKQEATRTNLMFLKGKSSGELDIETDLGKCLLKLSINIDRKRK